MFCGEQNIGLWNMKDLRVRFSLIRTKKSVKLLMHAKSLHALFV